MYRASFVNIQLALFSSKQHTKGMDASEGPVQVFYTWVNLHIRKQEQQTSKINVLMK